MKNQNNLPRPRILLIGIFIILMTLAGIFLLGAFNRSEDAAWEHVLNTGVLRVGMDAAYPPFESLGAENQIVGFDVDLANEIGRRLDVEMQFVNIAYDGLYDALLIGQVDVLISGLVAAPEFEGKAQFSTPYFNIGEHLVVQNGSSIRTMDDLAGRTLAVEYGSGGDVEARKWERRLSDLTVIRVSDPGAALAAVLNGEADAALVDGISARLGIGQHPELTIAGNVVDTLIAVAVHRESPVLRARIDEAIDAMLEDGTLARLIDQWFGPQN